MSPLKCPSSNNNRQIMIDTFTLKFNEAELEIISSALADYRDYAEGDTDPILARCNSIDDKIDEAFNSAL